MKLVLCFNYHIYSSRQAECQSHRASCYYCCFTVTFIVIAVVISIVTTMFTVVTATVPTTVSVFVSVVVIMTFSAIVIQLRRKLICFFNYNLKTSGG